MVEATLKQLAPPPRRPKWLPMEWKSCAYGFLTACLAFAGGVRAHPPDVSALQVKVQRQRVELRFIFNLLTLTLKT